MRDSDKAVERVLRGLGAVKSPAGMEGRVLLAMERRAAEPAPTGWQGVWRIVPVRAGVAGGVALAGLLCVVVWMAKPDRSSSTAKVEEVTSVHQAPVRGQAAVSLPPRTTAQPFRKARLLLVSAVSESDELALEEMRAPSQLAPPLPLTEQERLLMRVASRHDPEQIAVLNPEMRAQQQLQAKVEFQDFFEPARSAEETPIIKTNDLKGDRQ